MMNVTLRIKELNYEDAALWLLGRGRAVGTGAKARILRALSDLPEPVVRQVMDSIPDGEKMAILSQLVEENRDRLLQKLNETIADHCLGIIVTNLSLDPLSNLEATVGQIDGVKMAEQILPRLKNSVPMAGLLASAPKPLWAGILRRMSQEDIQRTAVQMIQQNVNPATEKITAVLAKNGIRCRICGLWAWM